MNPVRPLIPAVLILASLAAPASGVTPQTWRTAGIEGWMAAERESVGVSSSGSVRLSLAHTPVKGIDALTVWDLLLDGKDVLAAGGGGGSLFRIGPSGEARLVAKVIQPEITALGRDAAGRVLLGTAPDGVVYALKGDDATFVADTPSSYIWSILARRGGGAYLAGGNPGRIYRLGADGRVDLHADLDVLHITGMTAVDGDLVVTTDTPGRLVRVSGDGTQEVLFEAEERELRSPQLDPDGTLYFLGNTEGGNGASGRLYRRASSGAVDLLWTAASGAAYRLRRGAGDALWVSTGDIDGRGALIQVQPGPPSTWTEMLVVPQPQILGFLLEDGRPRWVATGGVGAVHRIPGGDAPLGKVTSIVQDAGASARWGALRLTPGPEARGVTVETRVGNTRRPDGSWSDWKQVTMQGNTGSIDEDASRFLQWRLTLGAKAAEVTGVRVAYLPVNRAPRVNEVLISELGASLSRVTDRAQVQGLAQQFPGGLRIEFQPGGGQNFENTASDEEAAWARRFRAVTWKALDPNGDPLRYAIHLRASGENSWKPVARDVEASPWIWDSSTVPDGWYEFQVEATDARENRPGEGMLAARATESFLVDNTPPRIEELKISDRTLTGLARDGITAVKMLEFAVDGGDWLRLFPEDGIPDTPLERFRQDLPGPPESGEHVVMVRAVDEAGNVGVGRVRYEVR